MTYLDINCELFNIKSLTLLARFPIGNEADPYKDPTGYKYKPIKKLYNVDRTSSLFTFFDYPVSMIAFVYIPLFVEVEFRGNHLVTNDVEFGLAMTDDQTRK